MSHEPDGAVTGYLRLAGSVESVLSEALPKGQTILWMLCHYPETTEASERVAMAKALNQRWRLPIWLFGSRMACYPLPTEQLLKAQLVQEGVPSEDILCSEDFAGTPESHDTVQEAMNVAAAAKQRQITTIICISNRLQLWQLRGLLRNEPLRLIYVSTTLKEWRCWYVTGRFILIPLAFAGIGPRFTPLGLLRRARAELEHWPF